jgi:hypothetical protein
MSFMSLNKQTMCIDVSKRIVSVINYDIHSFLYIRANTIFVINSQE